MFLLEIGRMWKILPNVFVSSKILENWKSKRNLYELRNFTEWRNWPFQSFLTNQGHYFRTDSSFIKKNALRVNGAFAQWMLGLCSSFWDSYLSSPLSQVLSFWAILKTVMKSVSRNQSWRKKNMVRGLLKCKSYLRLLWLLLSYAFILHCPRLYSEIIRQLYFQINACHCVRSRPSHLLIFNCG